MNIIIRILVFTACVAQGLAQQDITIKGKVIDGKDRSGIVGANAVLLHRSDSTVFKGMVTRAEGEFIFTNVVSNTYLLKLSYAGYNPRYIDVVPADAGPNGIMNLGVLELANVTGDAVVVEADKNRVEYSAGKKVFNVDESMTTASGNALDVLKQVPAVGVDLDGNVTLRGSSAVNIMIDNKPASAYGNVTQILQSLPASILDKVEVITNPNAKYDAEGQSGILNIILKKQQDAGVNGILTMGLSAYDNYTTSATTNVRQDDVNYFANADYSTYRSYRLKKADSKFTFGENLLREGFSYAKGNSYGAKLGADINLDSSKTLTVFGEMRMSDNNNDDPFFNTVTYVANPSQPNTYLNIDQNGGGPYKFGGVNVSYLQHLGPQKHDLSFDFYWMPNSFDIANQFIYTKTDKDGRPLDDSRTGVLSQTAGTSYYLQSQSDYALPINDSCRFETGVKAILQGIDSRFNYSTLNSGTNTFVRDQTLSNAALHHDNVFAAYVNYSNKIGDVSLQLGLRGEHTTNAFDNRLADSLDFYRAFGNLFPSAAVSYSFSDISSLNLSYSKRINRPNAQLLNPYLDKSDSLNWRTGNPKLTPEYTNALELGYLHYFDKVVLNTEVFYRRTTNMINQRFREQMTGSVLQEKPYNFGVGTAFGASVYTNAEIADWLSVNAEMSYYYQAAAGSFANQTFNSTGYGWNSKLTANAKLPFEVNGQMNLDYTAPQVIPQGRRFAWYMVNLSFNKEFVDRRLTVGLSWVDIFNTARFGGSVTGLGFSTDLLNQRDYNLVSLNLSYKINDFKGQRNRPAPNGGAGGGSTI